MSKYIIIFILFSTYFVLADTITVAQDSTGDFTVIQEAILAGSNNDTILVYPGIYYENIDYMGKTLVIGSLYLVTGEDVYIDSTIIDGNENGCVVTVENYEGEGTKIIGFTIQNGYNNYGGGISISRSYLDIINCDILRNKASLLSGGIYCEYDSHIFLSGSSICFNVSEKKYGGIVIGDEAQISFDTNNLCNIYGNYGGAYCDMYRLIDLENPVNFEAYLDTFSCLDPDRYFIGAGDDGFNLNWEYLDLHVTTAYYEFYDGDLFVSPDGNDNNSGTSPEEPMQTIAGAITRIVSNPDDPNTIFLQGGIYSSSLNGQLFPLNLKSHVNIVGDCEENVIWDGEGQKIILDYYSGFEYEIKNITFINGPSSPWKVIRIFQQDMEPMSIVFENLKFIDIEVASIKVTESIEFELRNILIENGSSGLIGYNSAPGNHSKIVNCQVINSGSGFHHRNYDHTGERSRLDVINTLIVDNLCETDGRGIWTYNSDTNGYAETNIVNCTIMNNSCDDYTNLLGCVNAQLGGNYNIYNSLIYGNDGYEVSADTGDGGILGSTITVSHSLIEGGESGIPLVGDYPSTLNWLDGNIDCDPMVDEDYVPIAFSPLIDAGTTELPYDIELPETDLAGNLRITGRTVDIGAFEFNPWGSGTDDAVINADQQLYVYPNPAVSGSLRKGTVTISWRGVREGDIQFDIYNAKGQKVRSVYNIYCQQAGVYQADWDLQNERGNKVSSGIYYVRIKLAGNYQEQQKVAVIN